MRYLTLLIAIFSYNICSAQWSCGDTLIDPRDGKAYVTIPYGSDCWFAQNLNYGQYVASNVTASPHSDVFNDGNVQKYCQNNDSTNCILYGGLYEWNELMNYSTSSAQGICPSGWHVATDAEWQSMILATGGTFSGNRGTGANDLKDLGEGVGADTGTNASGFAARAGGDRDAFGIFYGLGLRFIFWTSTTSSLMPNQYTLWAENDSIYRYDDAGMESGFSCRCVQDATSGIQDVNEHTGFNIVPNPAGQFFEIQIENYTEPVAYTIYSTQGQLVQTGVVSGNRQQIDVVNLQPGCYVVKVIQNGSAYNKQLIIAE
jgi:uncharacterized protein (TIGR02145 family)